MPLLPGERARRRLRHAGDRLLTAVGDWTAPSERPSSYDENSMSTLVRTVTAVAGAVFLLAMLLIWLLR
ncbi:hypothetical protein Ait01nite_086470 [Actinoplanes italicus]|uniref:Uncharacterized protein n=1 Tax=Actinoplanes italicus TaxID=113567 RepID=A0A2T0JYC6_9ACTN|nr:hypothetical protein [Actinoplanes italicus]PRX13880.1 hypothetical protein CLV67_12469 [Actinoplanes italicus]GIE35602.1 hypothetical protein Ait01nite_086470 [Actinoplanes italicus]